MSLENMTSEEVKFWHKGWRDAFESILKHGLWRCPECQGLMPDPPNDYHICPCCGVEFGYSAEEQAGELLWSQPAAHPETESKKP